MRSAVRQCDCGTSTSDASWAEPGHGQTGGGVGAQPAPARGLGPAVEGTLAGVLGATAVALWFLLVDINRGEPLRTPALLGGMILESVRNPVGIRATLPLILGYTVFHYMAFVLFGIFAASLAAAGEHDPLLLFGFFVLFVCFEVLFLGFVAIISHVLLEELGLGAIVTGNLLASIVMLVVFYRRHPQLLARLVRGWAQPI